MSIPDNLKVNQILFSAKLERNRLLNPLKYKTEPCTTFHTIGACPYGERFLDRNRILRVWPEMRLCSWYVYYDVCLCFMTS